MTIFSRIKRRQVFINYRGEELRYNFVSHLVDAFERHKVKFFVDKNELRGKDLENLFVRITESRIALVIFSTRYPESSWCLDELVEIKKLADEEKIVVIPIFYKVDARDVRKPTLDNEFGQNFWKLAEASKEVQIKKWKEALKCISNKMGLSLDGKRFEADFVKEIVTEVKRVIGAIELEERYKNYVNHCRTRKRKEDGDEAKVNMESKSAIADTFKSENLVTLSRQDIENLMKLENCKEPWIVVLYAPWCPFCQAMEASYDELTDKLAESKIKVVNSRADGDHDLKLVFPKNSSKPIKYPSEKRDVDSLTSFMNLVQ